MAHPVLDVVAEDPEAEQIGARRAARPPCTNIDVRRVSQLKSAGTRP